METDLSSANAGCTETSAEAIAIRTWYFFISGHSNKSVTQYAYNCALLLGGKRRRPESELNWTSGEQETQHTLAAAVLLAAMHLKGLRV
jgi:hypothetical protein